MIAKIKSSSMTTVFEKRYSAEYNDGIFGIKMTPVVEAGGFCKRFLNTFYGLPVSLFLFLLSFRNSHESKSRTEN